MAYTYTDLLPSCTRRKMHVATILAFVAAVTTRVSATLSAAPSPPDSCPDVWYDCQDGMTCAQSNIKQFAADQNCGNSLCEKHCQIDTWYNQIFAYVTHATWVVPITTLILLLFACSCCCLQTADICLFVPLATITQCFPKRCQCKRDPKNILKQCTYNMCLRCCGCCVVTDKVFNKFKPKDTRKTLQTFQQRAQTTTNTLEPEAVPRIVVSENATTNWYM